jgi:hypothetical protein
MQNYILHLHHIQPMGHSTCSPSILVPSYEVLSLLYSSSPFISAKFIRFNILLLIGFPSPRALAALSFPEWRQEHHKSRYQVCNPVRWLRRPGCGVWTVPVLVQARNVLHVISFADTVRDAFPKFRISILQPRTYDRGGSRAGANLPTQAGEHRHQEAGNRCQPR